MKWVVTVLLPVVVVPLLLTVFTDWSPRLARWIVARASRRMPKRYRDRCANEWRAYLADIPGGLSQLAVALGYWIRVPLLRKAVGAPAFRFRVSRSIVSIIGDEDSAIIVGTIVGAIGGAIIGGAIIGGAIVAAIIYNILGGAIMGAAGGTIVVAGIIAIVNDAVGVVRRMRARESTSPSRSRPRAGS